MWWRFVVPEMAKLQIATVNHHHRFIVDWELEHPGGKMKELAAILGCTEAHLSVVRNSDAFKDYRDRRRQAHDEKISKSVIEGVEELANTSVEVLNERIQKEREDLGLGIIKETADMALKALGYGGNRNGPLVGNLNIINGVPTEDLERARAKMREKAGPVVEGEYHEEGGALPAPL
jgi:hypothetical protein